MSLLLRSFHFALSLSYFSYFLFAIFLAFFLPLFLSPFCRFLSYFISLSLSSRCRLLGPSVTSFPFRFLSTIFFFHHIPLSLFLSLYLFPFPLPPPRVFSHFSDLSCYRFCSCLQGSKGNWRRGEEKKRAREKKGAATRIPRDAAPHSGDLVSEIRLAPLETPMSARRWKKMGKEKCCQSTEKSALDTIVFSTKSLR